MNITNIQKQKNGTHTFHVDATQEETGILINIAMDTLLSVGKIASEDFNKDKFNVNLNDIPLEAFYNAN